MTRRSTATGNLSDHVQLITDKGEVALREAQNGLRQFDEVLRLIRESDWALHFTPELIKNLQRIAVDGIWSSAGIFRKHSVKISNTDHEPPHYDQVPSLVQQMCDYVNENAAKPFHISAYLMWRLNWIHPFGDGNGRTSRAVSYLALSIALKAELPGSPTIPDLIVREKGPYYAALDAADAACRNCGLDVGKMELLLIRLLEQQLTSLPPK